METGQTSPLRSRRDYGTVEDDSPKIARVASRIAGTVEDDRLLSALTMIQREAGMLSMNAREKIRAIKMERARGPYGQSKDNHDRAFRADALYSQLSNLSTELDSI